MSSEEKKCTYIVTSEEIFDTKLCRAVEVFPCLYDTKSKLYRNRRTCDAAWQAISKRCNDTIINCKRRWIELYKTFVLNNFDQNTTTQLNQETNAVAEKPHLNECLKFLTLHMPFRLEELWEDNDKANKNDTKHDEDANNVEQPVMKENGNVTNEAIIEDETSLQQINTESVINIKTTDNTATAINGDGNDDDPNNSTSESCNNKSNTPNRTPIPDGINMPANCQSKVETFIIKPRDWNKTTAIPSTTSPSSSPILVASHFKNNNAEITKVNIAETDEGKRYNFRRSCKRHLNTDDSITSDVLDKEKRKKTLPLSDFNQINYHKRTPVISPSRKVEVKLARLSLNKKLRPLRPTKHNDSIKLNDSPSYKHNNSKHYDDDANVPYLKKIAKDCATQTERDSMQLDDDFLKSMRIQMNLMNTRQSLHFKFKVYKALMEVFDDASNFPNCNEVIDLPPTGAPRFDTTTNAELQLMRELVALVQAAKQTKMSTNNNNREATAERAPEFQRPPEVTEHPADKTLISAHTPNVATSIFGLKGVATPTSSTIDVSTTPPNLSNITSSNNEAGSSVVNNNEDSPSNVPRHIIRKVVKVGGVHGGTLLTQDGETKRIYRIYPKLNNNSVTTSAPATQRIAQSQGVNRSGTIFITQTSLSSATAVTTSSSTTTATNSARTMFLNNTRGLAMNTLPKSIIMRSADGSRNMLSSSGAQGTAFSNTNNTNINNQQRSNQIRTQPTPQMLRRYSISSSGPTLNVKANLTNGINHTNNNMGSIQKMTILTTTASTATTPINPKYRTLITNRRVPIPNQSIYQSNTDMPMPMIRSVRSMAPSSQSSTITTSSTPTQMSTTNPAGNNSHSSTLTTISTAGRPRTIFGQKSPQQQQQQQQQQQRQQQLPKLFNGKLSIAESLADDSLIEPLDVKIKTEPLD